MSHVKDVEAINADNGKPETTDTDEAPQAVESSVHPPPSSHCPQEEGRLDHQADEEKHTIQLADERKTDVSPSVLEDSYVVGGSGEKLEPREVIEECGDALAAAAVLQAAEQKDDEVGNCSSIANGLGRPLH